MTSLQDFADAPRLKWEQLADKMKSTDLQTLARNADAAAQLFAELGEYLEVRAMPSSHDHATKEAKRRLKMVRRALGYSVP